MVAPDLRPDSRPEPASFRDPENRVFYAGGEVLRGLTGAAVDDWAALSAAASSPSRWPRARSAPPSPCRPTRRRCPPAGTWCCVTSGSRSSRTRTSGPSRCCATLPCCTSTCCWRRFPKGSPPRTGRRTTCSGAAPGRSSSTWGPSSASRDGEPWAGYRQFCQTMLYPLLLQAHLGVSFQPWLRAQIDGIEPEPAPPAVRRHPAVQGRRAQARPPARRGADPVLRQQRPVGARRPAGRRLLP